MSTQPVLKVYDNDQMFRVVVSIDDREKEVYVSDNSITKQIKNFSEILNIDNFLQSIEYGDELFHDFIIDTNSTDYLNINHLGKQLLEILKQSENKLLTEQFPTEITKELKDNLTLDLAASVFDATAMQMLTFIINLSKDLNIEQIIFTTNLINIPRFKKIISSELEKYGITLLN